MIEWLGGLVGGLKTVWEFIDHLWGWRRQLKLRAEVIEDYVSPLVFLGGPPPETCPRLSITMTNGAHRPIMVTGVSVEYLDEKGSADRKTFQSYPLPKKLEETEFLEFRVPMEVPECILWITVTDSIGREWKIKGRDIKGRIAKS